MPAGPSARNVAFIANLMESRVDFVAVDMPEANRLDYAQEKYQNTYLLLYEFIDLFAAAFLGTFHNALAYNRDRCCAKTLPRIVG